MYYSFRPTAVFLGIYITRRSCHFDEVHAARVLNVKLLYLLIGVNPSVYDVCISIINSNQSVMNFTK